MILDGTSVWWQSAVAQQALPVPLTCATGRAGAGRASSSLQADVLVREFRRHAGGLGHGLLAGERPTSSCCAFRAMGKPGRTATCRASARSVRPMGGLRPSWSETRRDASALQHFHRRHARCAAHGVIGVLTPLYQPQGQWRPGQVIDVALHEAVFNVMESLLPEYSAFGAVREAGRFRHCRHRAVKRLSLRRRRGAHRAAMVTASSRRLVSRDWPATIWAMTRRLADNAGPMCARS